MKDGKGKLIPVILSGGKGSRLWPLSRNCFPKQYLKIGKQDEYTLLQNTFLRLKGLKNLGNPIIICNEEHRFIVAEQIRSIGIKKSTILLEPISNNTAPAITLAALLAQEESNNPNLLILSSDHEINHLNVFQKTILEGLEYSEQGEIVTFGIKPTSPQSGYGYIESYEALTDNRKCSNIKKFIEKPSFKLAESLIKNNHFTWNSGIFLSKASTILKELKIYEPKILEICKESLKEDLRDMDFQRINKDIFKKCPNIPFDKAVMEKTNLGTVLLLNCGWTDIGSWKSVWETSKKDQKGNVMIGNTLLKSSENCFLRSENRLLVGVGLSNTTIIETSDAVLVLNNESSQEVKNIVIELQKNNFLEGEINSRMYRPWGNYTSLINEKTWQVKRLEIKPNSSLSLQLHRYRAEHWVVVSGTAEVEINEKISLLNVNESIYVPKGAKHRLSNPSENLLVIIEIQSGSYLGEDDIIRLKDNYGRI